MVDFLMSGPDYFPSWISIAFSAGLALGIVHHLPCPSSVAGRWFHAGRGDGPVHDLRVPVDVLRLELAGQVADVVLCGHVGRDHRLHPQQVHPTGTREFPLDSPAGPAGMAMAYMWVPDDALATILIFVLVSWFAIETFGWPVTSSRTTFGDGRIAWFPLRTGRQTGRAQGRQPVTVTETRGGHRAYRSSVR